MAAQTIAERISHDLQNSVTILGTMDGIISVEVGSQDLYPVVQYLRDELDSRFITSIGMDKRDLSGCYEVANVFGLDSENTFLVLHTEVDPADPYIVSITPLIPGANWAEREARDMVGVHPIGHPDPRRLVLPDDWPEGVHPLRKDFRYNERPIFVPGAQPDINPPPKGSSVLPIGPFFPTLEEPAFINLYVDGENIVGVDYRGFFNHRGVEKLADATLTYNQVPFLAERICGI